VGSEDVKVAESQNEGGEALLSSIRKIFSLTPLSGSDDPPGVGKGKREPPETLSLESTPAEPGKLQD